jgi:hypothetical protein
MCLCLALWPCSHVRRATAVRVPPGSRQQAVPCCVDRLSVTLPAGCCWLWVPKSSCWLKPHPPRCTVSRSDGGHPLEVVLGATISGPRWATSAHHSEAGPTSASWATYGWRGGVRSRHVRRRCLELMGALYSYKLPWRLSTPPAIPDISACP